MFRFFITKITSGINIVTLGSISLLIASFLKPIYNDVSFFVLSAFCLIFSGSIIIYRESITKREALPTYEKFKKRKKLNFFDIQNVGELGLTNIIANTLFDIGLVFLLLGTFTFSVLELRESSIFNYSLWLGILIVVFLFENIFTRRHFVD